MTTIYTRTSHPLDISAAIREALDVDQVEYILGDLLPLDVLHTLIEWIDGSIKDVEQERNDAQGEADDFEKQLADLEEKYEKLKDKHDTLLSDIRTLYDNSRE